MADFKTALEALAAGKLELDVLAYQLEKLLQETPKHATHMLAELEEAFAQHKIDDKNYAALKGQINQYRRDHAMETESNQKPDAEVTEFAPHDNLEQAIDSEDATFVPEQAHSPENESEEVTVIPEAGGGDADATQILADDADATQVLADDATQVLADDADATQVLADDATQVLGDASQSDTGDVLDLGSPDSMDSIAAMADGTGPTNTDWQEPQQYAGYTPGKEFGPGDIIKQRFKLLKVLGIGGMGKVYMATDLLKEEARDKKPNVAIKLLNDDFKDHPEAFISLQRESSRQQKLAHPNIATIYDFDRVGGKGTPVFITMELMEGMELKDFIKKKVKKQGGLPFAEAFDIVKQLGDGLIYAHDRRLVHSDFKPGNAFLCNDGTVKTLDFGIARAVKNPVTGEAEKTLFDPGKLGALTPAYASLEMLEGEEPDTRDDTYALGCVAYELLTGKHPFNKLPATKARDNGLVPPAVKTVNKKTNRALRRAVAFKRADRSPTVEHFVNEFEGKPTWHKNPLTIAAGILLIIGIMMINPALDYLHKKGIEQTIADINSGDRQIIIEKLEEIKELDKAEQTQISNEAKEAIQRYYADEIAQQIDTSATNYNFPAANEILKIIAEIYPDSGFLLQQTDSVNFNKKQIETELYQQYIAATDPAAARENPGIIDTTKDILNLIRQRIDPAHPLLSDPRPSNAYRLAAAQAFADNNLDQALTLVNSGLQNAPGDLRLQDLQSRIQTRIEVVALNESLSSVQAELAVLGDYQPYQADIIKLANLSTPAESPVLSALSTSLKQTLDDELNRILQDGSRTEAEAMADEYGSLLAALLLGRELTQLKLSHLSAEEREQAVAGLISQNTAGIEQQLAAPDIDDKQWESTLLASVRELDSLREEAPSIGKALSDFRSAIAQLYVDQASTTLSANRFDAAEGIINRGERLAPNLAILQDTRNLIVDSKVAFEKQQRINDLKEQFRIQTEADRIAEARTLLGQLKAELPADDSYITSRAPSLLANSYARLSQRRAESREFATALKLAEAGLELAPRNVELRELRDEYGVEVNLLELPQQFKNARVLTQTQIVDISRKVRQIEQFAVGRFSDFRQQAETVLAERINFLAQTDENSAAALADAAVNIFPISNTLADLKDQFKLEPWPDRVLADAALDAGELTRAGGILDNALSGEYAGHPEVVEFQQILDEQIQQANLAYERYLQAREAAGNEFGKLRQTKKLLGRAQSRWLDNPDYDQAEIEIDKLIADAPDNPSKRLIAREQAADFSTASQEAFLKAQENWEPISSGRECSARLAGYGKRARAVCFDLVNTGWRGPQMVVVPIGEEMQRSFAIGKYEISVGDWGKYCVLSGNCKPVTDKARFNDPITGISLADAQEYAAWLTRRTGKNYRLPTRTEWEYAANAAGKQPQKDVNCRVTLGEKILKGTGIVSVKSGRANGWGLRNYIGNVQEWIMDESGALAAGGAFSDANSNCDISLQRPHNGNADEATGFRIVLEEIG